MRAPERVFIPVLAWALVVLLVPSAVPGCFRPDPDCRLLCGDVDLSCPDGFTCVVNRARQHVCAARGNPTCSNGGDNHTPPEQICIGARCLTLSQTLRAGMVLWLDPSNLPPAEQDVTIWLDQSGQLNDARILDNRVVPKSNGHGVDLHMAADAGFIVTHDASLNFGPSDFVVLVEAEAGISDNEIAEFFFKSNADRPLRQIEIGLLFSSTNSSPGIEGAVNDTSIFAPPEIATGSQHLVTLRRAGDQLDLRINGISAGTRMLAPGESADNDADLFLGIAGRMGYSIDSLGLIMAIRGPVETGELMAMEAFLKSAFNLPP